MTKKQKYVVVFDQEGDIYCGITSLTEDQAIEVENLSAVCKLISVDEVKNLPKLSAAEVLALRSEFDEEE